MMFVSLPVDDAMFLSVAMLFSNPPKKKNSLSSSFFFFLFFLPRFFFILTFKSRAQLTSKETKQCGAHALKEWGKSNAKAARVKKNMFRPGTPAACRGQATSSSVK